MTTLRIEVEGLERANRIPGALDDAQRDFIQKAADALADEVGRAAPGGRGGAIGSSFQGRALTNTTALIYSRHPGAKANEVGAYIVPRPGKKAIVFRDGRVRAWARIPALHYAKNALRTRSRVVNAIYEREFGNLNL